MASALYSPDMIVSCVENAIAVLNGEEVEHTIVLPSEIVDRDNVADHLDANSPVLIRRLRGGAGRLLRLVVFCKDFSMEFRGAAPLFRLIERVISRKGASI